MMAGIIINRTTGQFCAFFSNNVNGEIKASLGSLFTVGDGIFGP